MADSKDIVVPSAGNKNLQPDILALGKTRDFKNSASDLRSGKFDTSLGDGNKYTNPSSDLRSGKFDTSLTPASGSSFDRDSNGLYKLKTDKSNFYRGSDGLLRRTGDAEPNLLRKTISAAPTQKRGVDADGPKSTLRPSANSSPFGRAVPYSGWFPMKFKSRAYDNAVGGLGNPVEIPTFGLHSLSFPLGSTTLQGMSWNGGIPNINIAQNSTATTTTFHQAENEHA